MAAEARREDTEYRPHRGPFYHYTSIDSLLGIVSSRVLWATNIAYLNDASESQIGLELLRRAAAVTRDASHGVEQEFLDFLLPSLDLEIELVFDHAVHVLCFSEERDQLGQWRGYAPHGKGVCIGFNSGALIERMQAQSWEWQACRYSESSHLAYVTAILSRMRREALEQHTPDKRSEHFAMVLARTFPEVLRVAAFIKHSAFAEEMEWRFMSPVVQAGSRSVQFRPGRTTLIPYIEFALCRDETGLLPIDEIVVGPSPTQQESRFAIMGLMKRHGLERKAVVNVSDIPYREL